MQSFKNFDDNARLPVPVISDSKQFVTLKFGPRLIHHLIVEIVETTVSTWITYGRDDGVGVSCVARRAGGRDRGVAR